MPKSKKPKKVRELDLLVRKTIAAEADRISAEDSLSSGLESEIDQITHIRSFLPTYSGDHPVLLRMQHDMSRAPLSWVPDPRDRDLFMAVLRRAKETRRIVVDPLEKALAADVSDGPTSLDP